MARFTTESPKSNFDTMLNMVFNKDGWQHIRYGEEVMPTTEFCMMLCHERGCQPPESATESNEAMDEWLCECVYEKCPIAMLYAALSGFGHVRDRLKKYEDAGIEPPKGGGVMNNADRIRSMSKKELAEWLVDRTGYRESAWSETTYLNFLTGEDDTRVNAIADTLKWLQQQAEGAE